jgi:glycosyltransferase involved in cell wall biosynthesis
MENNNSIVPISVLLSVYYGDSSDWLRASLLSIYNQRILPSEVVIVEDGPISNDVFEVIHDFRRLLNIKSVICRENCGLGAALNQGLKHCSNELVCRMDSDDECLTDRFLSQYTYMLDNPNIVASSGFIDEYDQSMMIFSGKRVVPVNQREVLLFSKKRSPLNHVATIFRKSIVESLGGYPPLRKGQDYALWSLLLVSGYKLGNLNKTLVKVRAGDVQISRRKIPFELLNFQRKIGFIKYNEYLKNLTLWGLFYFLPITLKGFIHNTFRLKK